MADTSYNQQLQAMHQMALQGKLKTGTPAAANLSAQLNPKAPKPPVAPSAPSVDVVSPKTAKAMAPVAKAPAAPPPPAPAPAPASPAPSPAPAAPGASQTSSAAPSVPDYQTQVKAAQDAYIASLAPSPESAATQEQLGALKTQSAADVASAQQQYADRLKAVQEQATLQPFLTGREQQAQQQLTSQLAAIQAGSQAQTIPLQERLAQYQARQQAQQAQAQAKLGFATPQTKEISAGATVYDPTTGKAVFTAPKEPTTGILSIKDIATIAASSSNPTAVMKALTPYVGKSAAEAGNLLSTLADPNFDALQKKNVGAGVNITPEAQQLIGQIYATTGSMPYIRTQAQADAIDMAAKGALAQGKSPADIISQQTEYKADASSLKKLQATADATHMNEKKAMGAADIVLGINDKVWRTASPFLNTGVIFVAGKVFGDSDTQNLANAVQTLTTEYGKVIANAAGNSELTVGAQKSAENRISAAQSPQNLKDTINLLKQEMTNSANAVDSQLSDIKGRIQQGGQSGTDTHVLPDGTEYIQGADGLYYPKSEAPAAGAKTGGSVSFRNNNPLNIKMGSFAGRYGATPGTQARDGGQFATFPDVETGLQAAKDLLRSDAYASLPLDTAMKKWSGNGYGAEVAPADMRGKTIGTMTDAEIRRLIDAMKNREGWQEGNANA